MDGRGLLKRADRQLKLPALHAAQGVQAAANLANCHPLGMEIHELRIGRHLSLCFAESDSAVSQQHMSHR